MQKHRCNNCGNQFSRESSVKPICPVCGNNNFEENKNSWESFLRDKIFLIALVVMILMILILFLLPGHRMYDVTVNKYPEQCKFSIVVKQGNTSADPGKFQYSDDNGKTWQRSPDFLKDLPGTFWIKVKLENGDTTSFHNYKNQVEFTPSCPALNKGDCDCKILQVTTVYQTFINGKQAVVVRASLPKCTTKQYLFTVQGKEPVIQDDSIFYPSGNVDITVAVQTASCLPVSYAMNPFHVTPPPLKELSKSELQTWINNFIRKPRNNDLMTSILKRFEDKNTVNVIRGKATYPYDIHRYLTEFKFNQDTIRTVMVEVLELTSNTTSKNVKQVTFREFPIK